jgi:hypothetical protein
MRVRKMSEADRGAIGKRGRQYVAANYDRNVLADRYLEILTRLARRGVLARQRPVSA